MSHQVWFITTPIYYPSDNLHIGHAYTTVAADALARFHRLRGETVWFSTGTDEHGQKIMRAAEARGLSPQTFVDTMVAGIRDLWDTLRISYDDFVRTTDPRHEAVVQAVFERIGRRAAERLNEAVAEKPAEDRMAAVVSALRASGVAADVQKTDLGMLVLHEHNCPYASVVGENPEACSAIHTILESVVPGDAKQVESIATGGAECRFEINVAEAARA